MQDLEQAYFGPTFVVTRFCSPSQTWNSTPPRIISLLETGRLLLKRGVVPTVRRDPLHKCGECGYGTDRLSNYKRHCVSHQRLGTPRSCCENIFATLHDLKKHKIDVHGKREYRCSRDDCDMVFRQKSNLRRHLASHDNVRPFVCSGCFYRSSTTYNLRRHQASSRCPKSAASASVEPRIVLPLKKRPVPITTEDPAADNAAVSGSTDCDAHEGRSSGDSHRYIPVHMKGDASKASLEDRDNGQAPRLPIARQPEQAFATVVPGKVQSPGHCAVWEEVQG
ncbi:hypothetical protein MTO96_034371 [Rhipicephalus appendiculatus]